MGIQDLRDSIAATRDSIYMNTGWAGPSPKPVVDRINEILQREAASGPASLEGIRLTREATEETQVAVAGFLNAGIEEILLTHGTTEGVHIVLHGYPWQPGDELITCDLEHMAIATAVSVLEERHGVVVKRLEIAATASEQEMLDQISEAITPHTRMVALSHVQYTCGLKMPVEKITQIAHHAGALVLVDGAQTGGHLNLDMQAMGADFYSISGQKWVMGPQGTGALFVAGDRWRLINPLFNTHSIVDTRAALRPEGAPGPGRPLGRFRVTSQNAGLIAGFGKAVSLLQEIGMDVVEEHNARLAERFKAGLAEAPHTVLTGPLDAGVSCGLVSVAIDGWQPRQIVESLWERWRIAGRAVGHPAAVRFSTHIFNTEAEVDSVIDAIRTLSREEAPVLEAEVH